MNTSSFSPIASGTYNRWKVEFVLKTKMNHFHSAILLHWPVWIRTPTAYDQRWDWNMTERVVHTVDAHGLLLCWVRSWKGHIFCDFTNWPLACLKTIFLATFLTSKICTGQVRPPYTEHAASGLPNHTHLEGEGSRPARSTVYAKETWHLAL